MSFGYIQATPPITAMITGTVAVTQSGPWSIADITGVVSLPTGASTALLQSTGNTLLASIDNRLSTPVVVGGQYNESGITLSNLETAPVQMDIFGNVKISGPVAIVGTPTVLQGTTPWITDGSGYTQPISAVSLPLPTGAATEATLALVSTEATLAALNAKVTTTANGIKVDGTATVQPVSGPLTDTQLRATPVPVSGTLAVTQSTSPWVISGTVTANAGTNLNTSLLALDSTVAKDASLTTINTSINTLLKPANTLAAVTSITNPVAATQSGNWSVRTQDGAGNLLTSQANGAQRALDVGIDVAGVQLHLQVLK